MQVVATAADGLEALEAFDATRPDITLMDLRLPHMSGVDAIAGIRSRDPGALVVVLTVHSGDEDIHRALDAGAATYVLKDTLSDDLVKVIRQVHAGGRPLAPEVRERLETHARRPHLTGRELDVLTLLARGWRNKDIASELAISDETVHVHLKNIYAKLHVNDRTAAVIVASQRGIIHLDDSPGEIPMPPRRALRP
jgi:DNA-binding NarL/FixJ family response regulator